MSAEIRICYEYVRGIGTKVQDCSEGMRQSSVPGDLSLRHSETVLGGLRDLNGRWSKKRNELAGSLDELADMFNTTAQSFEEADAELASSLDE